eukprot:CAMPEP_0196581512 /NCGR_PEP_ID=MMETSP1081-20130531/34009_1 /TAXON_ID=36882 /ORGANISM="Pyramimonas amylifera, Strain CCMP720" /LENGTH=292 /DNA_ID=CAMNT_0041901767 /DNA_START=176 /DNA_END=1054 /DNA_ORIENTATION=-
MGPSRTLHKDLHLTPAEHAVIKEQAKVIRDKTRAAVLDPNVPPEEKHHLQAVMRMEAGRGIMLCPSCFLLPGNCCCAKWTNVTPKHNVCIYMHHSEWGKGINSGIVLKTSAGARLWVSGHRDHEAEMREMFETEHDQVVVLWPPDPMGDPADLETPIPVEQLMREYPEIVENGLQILAIDATWSNARRLVKRLPSTLRRCYLPAGAFAESLGEVQPGGNPSASSILRPVRKYKGHDERVCTLEAVVAILRTVGESPDVCNALLNNLKMKVDATLAQKARPPIYNVETSEKTA